MALQTLTYSEHHLPPYPEVFQLKLILEETSETWNAIARISLQTFEKHMAIVQGYLTEEEMHLIGEHLIAEESKVNLVREINGSNDEVANAISRKNIKELEQKLQETTLKLQRTLRGNKALAKQLCRLPSSIDLGCKNFLALVAQLPKYSLDCLYLATQNQTSSTIESINQYKRNEADDNTKILFLKTEIDEVKCAFLRELKLGEMKVLRLQNDIDTCRKVSAEKKHSIFRAQQEAAVLVESKYDLNEKEISSKLQNLNLTVKNNIHDNLNIEVKTKRKIQHQNSEFIDAVNKFEIEVIQKTRDIENMKIQLERERLESEQLTEFFRKIDELEKLERDFERKSEIDKRCKAAEAIMETNSVYFFENIFRMFVKSGLCPAGDDTLKEVSTSKDKDSSKKKLKKSASAKTVK